MVHKRKRQAFRQMEHWNGICTKTDTWHHIIQINENVWKNFGPCVPESLIIPGFINSGFQLSTGAPSTAGTSPSAPPANPMNSFSQDTLHEPVTKKKSNPKGGIHLFIYLSIYLSV